MKNNPETTVYIIIPVFNRIKFTKECLSSITNQTYKNIRTIVVDDGSTDGTIAYLKKYYPKVIVINGASDWWWTRSMYEGVKHVLKTAKEKDLILEMNNDCYFGNQYISQLVKTSFNNPKKIIGSLCVKSDNPREVVEAGVKIKWSEGLVYGLSSTISNKKSCYKGIPIIENLDALPGKGTLIPIQVFKKIGNFNYKRLPHYIADYEFTNRAKRAGFSLIVDTKAIVYHHWKETGVAFRYSGKNRTYKEAWNLLFGRKSMNNLIDWINFLFLACPKKYLLINFRIIIFKVMKSGLHVFPFYYLQTKLPKIAKVYNKIFKSKTR